MRALMIILSMLCFLATAGIGILASGNGFGEDADKAAKVVESIESSLGADNPKVQELRAVLSGYKKSSIGALLSVVIALAGVILIFLKKESALLKTLGAAVVVTAIFTILSPGIDTGDQMNPRMQAMVTGIGAILTALFAFLAEKKRAKA